jgi:hypothetical protein
VEGARHRGAEVERGRDFRSERQARQVEGERRHREADGQRAGGAAEVGGFLGRSVDRERESEEEEPGRTDDRGSRVTRRLDERADVSPSEPERERRDRGCERGFARTARSRRRDVGLDSCPPCRRAIAVEIAVAGTSHARRS